MFVCVESRAEAKRLELTRPPRVFWKEFAEDGLESVLFLDEFVLVTEDERCESRRASANWPLVIFLAFREAPLCSGVTLVMRLARSVVLVEFLPAALELCLFARFRPKISLARASFCLRCRPA